MREERVGGVGPQRARPPKPGDEQPPMRRGTFEPSRGWARPSRGSSRSGCWRRGSAQRADAGWTGPRRSSVARVPRSGTQVPTGSSPGLEGALLRSRGIRRGRAGRLSPSGRSCASAWAGPPPGTGCWAAGRARGDARRSATSVGRWWECPAPRSRRTPPPDAPSACGSHQALVPRSRLSRPARGRLQSAPEHVPRRPFASMPRSYP